jgi:hypothetical protein
MIDPKERVGIEPPAIGWPSRLETIGWPQLLLSKFPTFDPAWPDDVKSKWFNAFDKLMKTKPEGMKP